MKKWIYLALGVILFFAFIERLIKYLGDIPDPAQLINYTPSLTTKIYDINGEMIAELFTEKRTFIPISQIPKDMINAVIAIEDTRFFNHWGIDPYRIVGAFVSNLKAGGVVEGGSTITQQLSKIIFLSRRKTLTRKIKEVILALQLERDYSKYEILEMYLNQIYFGSGAYGITTAAKLYFGKNVQNLTLEECALLAGLPRAPSMYSPFKNPEKAIQRRAIVLARMRDVGFITNEQKKIAEEKNIVIAPPFITTKIAPHFIDNIRQSLEVKYGSQLYEGGLEIYTTLDKKMQIAAESVFQRNLTNFDSLKKSTSPVEGALLCLDVKTGGIRALVGGRNFQTSQFNRVFQAQRQPGSSFKAFVYTAAIENGFTPVSIIEDTPVTFFNNGRDWELLSNTTDFSDVQDKILLNNLIKKDKEAKNPNEKVLWKPQNYSEKFYGLVLLRKALEHSLNICSIKITEKISPTVVAYYAKQLGIESPLTATLSLALGSSEVTLKEMTSAFECLANSGIKTIPYSIVRILNSKGRILEEYAPEEKDVITPQTAFIMTNLLRGVIEHGTGVNAKELRRPAAGKTGTTNDCADAWFIGYTPQLVCGVWVGYDNHQSLGNKMTGGRIACPIWTEFMRASLKGQPTIDFSPPSNITFVKIDPKTGLLSLGNSKETYLESFITGTEPKEFSFSKDIATQSKIKKIDDETEVNASTVPAISVTKTNLVDGTTKPAPVLPTINNDSEGGF
ncbi:MAG: transglycosylase domain-containing protein [Elusimicrobia bacterium]|nr:transglycosylase domain-containing protein [Elusimicrobiota bacterium]